MWSIDKSQRQSRMTLINVRVSGLKLKVQKIFNRFFFDHAMLFANLQKMTKVERGDQ